MDFKEEKAGKFQYKYLVIFIDTFSGRTETIPTKHETTQMVTKKLLKKILQGILFLGL